MASGMELVESRMVQHPTSHLIKPKMNAKFKPVNDHLTKHVSVLDQGNVKRNLDVEVDPSGTHMTRKHIKGIQRAKEQAHEDRLASRPIHAPNLGVALGENVVDVEDRETYKDTIKTPQVVFNAPPPASLQIFPEESIPVGSQYVIESGTNVSGHIPEARAMDLFPVLDYDLFEKRAHDGYVENVEHTSALVEGAKFRPMRTPFDQHSASRYRDLVERSSMKAKIFHNTKSIASELGKYENMLENQDRSSYIMEVKATTPVRHPQYGQEFLIQTPQRGGPPAFVRSIRGAQIGYHNSAGEIEQ